MADNFVSNPGSGGSTFAADDIGPGVLYPRVKLTTGVDGVSDGDVSASNPIPARLYGPATGTQSNVAAATTDTTILASNASRRGAVVFNDSTAVLYVLLANATSSATVWTYKLNGGDYLTIEQGEYTGVIKGLWASATGSARVTEFT